MLLIQQVNSDTQRMHNDPDHFKSIPCLLACIEFMGTYQPKNKLKVSNVIEVIGYEK